jgi:hypothetical protein
MVVLASLACEGTTFLRPSVCDTCPLPPTIPPVVRFVVPVDGGTVTSSTLLVASATDDRQVTGVEFFYAWQKLHPGVIGAPPYQMVLGKYYHEFPTTPGFILLEVVAHDVEGNADTAQVLAQYQP